MSPTDDKGLPPREVPGKLVIYRSENGPLRLQARLHVDSQRVTSRQVVERYDINVPAVREPLQAVTLINAMLRASGIRRFLIAATNVGHPLTYLHRMRGNELGVAQ